MYIISHRGAAGLALENTRSSINLALSLRVDMIEVDARLTHDRKIVLCHDSDLSRVAGDKRKISNHNYSEIKDVTLNDGSKLLTLDELLSIVGSTPIMLELKDSGSEYSLLAALDKFPKAQVSVASFKLPQLAVLKELRPTLKLYALEHTKALDNIQIGRTLKLSGVGINFWTLNPLVYWLAQRAKLDVYVYTVNSKFLAWFLRFLYPKAKICTDYPDRLMPKKTTKKV